MARRRSHRQRERSKRFWLGLFKFVVVLGLIAAVGYYGYETGRRLSASEISDLRATISRMESQVAQHEAEVMDLRATTAKAQEKAADYRRRYEELAPEAMREIIAAAKARLEEGMSAQRLAFVVSQAQEPRNCSDTETRRFIAQTPNYDGANTWVRFNGAVTVTALGEGANNGVEQWFDPEKPVTATFTPLGGEPQKVRGRLPLEHALVFKGKEYRFNLAPGARSFIEVTADWCDYGN